MEFTAKIGGRPVTYPEKATFIVERRTHGQRQYGLVAHRETIQSALRKAHSSEREGSVVRLSACHEGHVKHLARFA